MHPVIVVDGARGQLRGVFEWAPGDPTDGAHGCDGVFRFFARVFGVEVPDFDSSVAATAGTMFPVGMPVHREYRTIMRVDLAFVDIILTVVPSLRYKSEPSFLPTRPGDRYLNGAIVKSRRKLHRIPSIKLHIPHRIRPSRKRKPALFLS